MNYSKEETIVTQCLSLSLSVHIGADLPGLMTLIPGVVESVLSHSNTSLQVVFLFNNLTGRCV